MVKPFTVDFGKGFFSQVIKTFITSKINEKTVVVIYEEHRE